MMRSAILIDDRDQRVGRVQVPETAFVIQHGEDFYVRTSEVVRLSRNGPGLAAVFRITEVFVRAKLEPV